MRNAQTVRSLARYGPVDVISLGVTDPGATPDADITVEWTWDELARDRRQIDRIKARAWPVLPGNHWRQNIYLSRAALADTARLALTRNHDLVVASAWQTGPYAQRARRSARLVFDTHNIEAELLPAITPSAAGRKQAMLQRIDRRRVVTIERSLGNRADQVWTCSDDDSRLWRRIHGAGAQLQMVPNTVAVAEALPAERRPYRMLLTGTFSYPPNIAAARELVDDILPAVRAQVPDATVELVGREPGPKVTGLAGATVTVVGPVPEMAPHLAQASVMVVPLRSGGGTRLKILEAMAADLPVVSTSKGVEGITATPGEHFLVGETPGEIADAVVRLFKEPALAARLTTAARDLVIDRYGEGALDRAVDDALDRLEVL